MFDRRVQVLKNGESIRVFLVEGHYRSPEGSPRELDGIGHLDRGRTLRMIGEVVSVVVAQDWDVAEGQRRVCESRTW